MTPETWESFDKLPHDLKGGMEQVSTHLHIYQKRMVHTTTVATVWLIVATVETKPLLSVLPVAWIGE